MITIIHGDDISKSREYFISEKQKAKDPVSFGKDLSIPELMQITEGGSLFHESKDIFIENFLSLKKSNSKEFKEITEYINNNSAKFNFFFWDGKALEKNIFTIFNKASQKIFNFPQNLFSFLDAISPKNTTTVRLFHECLKNSSEEIILFMIIRQFRLLLAVSNDSQSQIDEIKRLAPWQKSKFLKQLKLFSNEELLNAYSKLLEIDLGQKSGTLGKNLVQAIDIFLLSI